MSYGKYNEKDDSIFKIGLMQVGLGTAAVAASPLHNDGSSQLVQLDRHDREYRHYRHDHRDRRNNDDDNTMNVIAAGAIGFVLGSATN
jgi:hypothetical protein